MMVDASKQFEDAKAAFTTSGLLAPRAFRRVANLLILTLSRVICDYRFPFGTLKRNYTIMSLKTTIDNDIKKAMLAKNKEELEALRSIKSMILLAETEKGHATELTGEVEGKLLMKAAKQRKESAEIFQKEGRQDLAQRENFQLEIISRYLPKQMSEAEITEALKGIIASVGAKGPQDMGKVMGNATKALAGKADGKLISEIVKKLLTA